MKTKFKEASQSRLEVRDGLLCIVVETALDGGASKAGSATRHCRRLVPSLSHPLP
jgi:hypothetical protein